MVKKIPVKIYKKLFNPMKIKYLIKFILSGLNKMVVLTQEKMKKNFQISFLISMSLEF